MIVFGEKDLDAIFFFKHGMRNRGRYQMIEQTLGHP